MPSTLHAPSSRRIKSVCLVLALTAGVGLVACSDDDADPMDDTPTTDVMMDDTPTTDVMMDDTPTTDVMMDDTTP